MTNKEFSEDGTFINAVRRAAQTLYPDPEDQMKFEKKHRTTRQASKYRRGTGIVWKTINNRK